MAFPSKTTRYDPKRVSVIWGPLPIHGFAPGSFVTVRRNVNLWRQEPGTNGEMPRLQSVNKSGTVTVTLRHTSTANRPLGIFVKADEGGGGMIQPLAVADALNGGLFFGGNAYIDRYPDVSYALNEPDITWTFFCEELDMTLPGFSIETLLSRI